MYLGWESPRREPQSQRAPKRLRTHRGSNREAANNLGLRGLGPRRKARLKGLKAVSQLRSKGAYRGTRAENLSQSRKPTPPLDRKVPVNQSPVLLLVSRKGAQTELCAWCPQSVSGARAVLKTLQKKLSKPSWACEFKEASELPKQRVRRLAGSVG